LNALTFAHQLVDALAEHKGEDIILLDIHKLAPFADYFVICSGTSDRMLNALARVAAEEGKKAKIPGRIEGTARSGWVLIDFGEVVVHLFSPDLRSYYRLENLWGDGQVLLRVQ